MFNDITNVNSQKVQNKCPAQANEVATYAAKFRSGYWCVCGPGSEKTWNYHEDLTKLQTVNQTNSLSGRQENFLPANTRCSCVRTFFKQVY